MMQANELRIGNWVCVDYSFHVQITGIGEVDRYTQGRYYHSSGYIFSGNCTGIPLTPELLEKCGFYEVKDKVNIFRTGDDVYQISFGDGANSLFYRVYNPGEYCYLQGWLYYLHQLQNLYFALTGTELSITL